MKPSGTQREHLLPPDHANLGEKKRLSASRYEFGVSCITRRPLRIQSSTPPTGGWNSGPGGVRFVQKNVLQDTPNSYLEAASHGPRLRAQGKPRPKDSRGEPRSTQVNASQLCLLPGSSAEPCRGLHETKCPKTMTSQKHP